MSIGQFTDVNLSLKKVNDRFKNTSQFYYKYSDIKYHTSDKTEPIFPYQRRQSSCKER